MCQPHFMIYSSIKNTLNAQNQIKSRMWVHNTMSKKKKKYIQTSSQLFHQGHYHLFAISAGGRIAQWHLHGFLQLAESHRLHQTVLSPWESTGAAAKMAALKQRAEGILHLFFRQNKWAHLGLKSEFLPAEQGLLGSQKLGQSLLSTCS